MAKHLRVLELTNQDERFYPLMGPFLSRREIVKELGSPVWDDDGKRWFLAMQGKRVVGFAALRKVGQHQSLVSAYVLPEARKSGAYRALLEARIRAAGGAPLKAIATASAVPALRKAGLKSTGKRGSFTIMERA